MPRLLLLILFVLSFGACESARDTEYPQNLADCYRLHGLARKKAPAQPGDWLYGKPEEMHQSLKAYIASGPLKQIPYESNFTWLRSGTSIAARSRRSMPHCFI